MVGDPSLSPKCEGGHLPVADVRAQLEAQQRIQDLIARHAPLETTLAAISRMGEQLLPGALVSIMLFDAERQTLTLAGGDSLSPAYRAGMQDIPIGPRVGSCGSAAYLRQLVITEDIAESDAWCGFHALARAEGVRACWSMPVLGRDGALLGTFATYYRGPGVPDEADQAHINRAAGLVALAVERHQERRTLEETEQRYRSLFTEHPDAVFQIDMAGRLCALNRAAGDILGLPESRLLGRHYNDLVTEDCRQRCEEAFAAAVRGEPQHYEIKAYRANADQPVALDITNLPIIVDDQVIGIYGIARDITLRKQYEARLAYYASHDALTGLPNRREFESRLAHDFELCRRHCQPLAVLYIDLDDFKPVNDSLGHAFGDRLLVATARRLEKLLGLGDTLSRFGGDEFVLLLPSLADEEEALALADRVLGLFCRSHTLGTEQVHISASVGIAFSHDDVRSPEELVQFANRAMQQAKRQGRNTWRRYAGDDGAEPGENVSLRRDLQEAISNDQLSLHYQPVVDATSGELRSIEALVRWHHPERGTLSPGVFIPLAEQTGQIIEIGQWILRRACSDMMALQGQGVQPIPVAVNISPLQFARPSFVANLAQVLAETGLPAHLLELELTEGVLMADADGAIASLKALRELGVHAAIDDFGTGFSSLSYLRYLPINKVKLDRSFISDMMDSRGSAAIVQGVITMAHHLSLEVVAEGIETEAQWQALRGRDCDLLQGYLFAHPMPLAQLVEKAGLSSAAS